MTAEKFYSRLKTLIHYFKYTNFAITNINLRFGKEIPLKELYLPVGISFFAFQQIAYIVAIYRKELPSAKAVDYLAYILYYPKLLMGSLMELVDFLGQLNNPELKKVDWDHIAYGVNIPLKSILTLAVIVIWL